MLPSFVAIRYNGVVVRRATCSPENPLHSSGIHLVDRISWFETVSGVAASDTPSTPDSGGGRCPSVRIEPGPHPSVGLLALETPMDAGHREIGVESKDSPQLERGTLEGKDLDEMTTNAET